MVFNGSLHAHKKATVNTPTWFGTCRHKTQNLKPSGKQYIPSPVACCALPSLCFFLCSIWHNPRIGAAGALCSSALWMGKGGTCSARGPPLHLPCQFSFGRKAVEHHLDGTDRSVSGKEGFFHPFAPISAAGLWQAVFPPWHYSPNSQQVDCVNLLFPSDADFESCLWKLPSWTRSTQC